MEYIDDYGTCESTYATLCIYTHAIDPAFVTESLCVQPSDWRRVGELPYEADVSKTTRRNSRPAKLSAWFLSSQNLVMSRDARRHIDWVLDQILSKSEALFMLQEQGCNMKVSCFWASACGHGGPKISPTQMRKLAGLNLELEFDIYEADSESDA